MLRAKKSIMAAGLIVLVAVGAALAIDKRPDSPGPGASSKELVAASRRAYELLRARRAMQPDVSTDEIYLWSKRWMTAEWDLGLQAGAAKGVKAHLERMRDLEDITTKLHAAGQVPASDVAAAAYYRTEAELMLARTGE
jgi:hypothetical protein